jgi:AcrR family transcriptional regulator
LEAAGEVFAEQGFRATTVREICRRAGANIAALHYHFGGKEEMYEAVIADTARQSLEQYPIGGGLGSDAPAAARLEAFVRNYLERLLNEGRPAWFGQLLAREMFEPTRALDKLAAEFARPQFERLREIVVALLGGTPEEALVRRCCMSIVGQCLFYKHARPMIQRLMPDQSLAPPDRAEIARHITRFSLEAIRGLAGRNGARP